MSSDGSSLPTRAKRAGVPFGPRPLRSFLYKGVPTRLRLRAEDKQALKDFLRQLSERLGYSVPVCCLVTDDQELQKLNRDFLQHDYPTDVLSFPPLDTTEHQPGELAISIERAEAQAAFYGHSLYDELRILILHGMLHLAGFDHARDRGEMARAERRLRAEFALPRNMIARVAK